MADLIRQQPCPVRIPPREVVETEQFVDELLGEETTVTVAPPQPPERTRRSTRLLGLLAGAVVLVGAVTAASAITSNNWTAPQAEQTPEAGANAMVGPVVLRPDLVTAALISSRTSPRAATAPPLASSAPQARAGLGGEAPQTMGGRGGRAVQTTAPGGQRTAVTQPPAQGENTPVGTVKRFYQRLSEKQPAQAAELLTPNLLGDLTAFTRSWTGLRGLELLTTKDQPDGSVLAVVRLQQADGSWLTLEQVLRVASGAPLRITGAELRSAQRG